MYGRNMTGGGTGWVPGRGSSQGRDFPRAGILPGAYRWGGAPGQAPGCRVIEGNQRIPTIVTPGAPLINWGYSPINQGPVSVKDHPWEHSLGTPEPPEG